MRAREHENIKVEVRPHGRRARIGRSITYGDALSEANASGERGLDGLKGKRSVPAKDNERRE